MKSLISSVVSKFSARRLRTGLASFALLASILTTTGLATHTVYADTCPSTDSLCDSAVIINVTGISGTSNFYSTGHSFGSCSSAVNQDFAVPSSGRTCVGHQFGPLSLYVDNAALPSGTTFNGFTLTYTDGTATGNSSCIGSGSGSYCNFIYFDHGTASITASFTQTTAPAPVSPPPAAPAPVSPVPSPSSAIDSHVTINTTGYNGVLNLYSTGHSFGDCNSATYPGSTDFTATSGKVCSGAQFGTPITGNLTNGVYLSLRSIPAGYQLSSIGLSGATSVNGVANNNFSCASNGNCYFNFDSGNVTVTYNFTALPAGTTTTPTAPVAPVAGSTPIIIGSGVINGGSNNTVIVDNSTNDYSTHSTTVNNNNTSAAAATNSAAAKTTTSSSTTNNGKGLVNTGPGEVFSLFSATSVGAGAAHNVFTRVRRKTLGF